MTLKGYFLQVVDSHDGLKDLVHHYPGVDGKIIECFEVDYTLYDTETNDDQIGSEFMFNLDGFFHWNGYSLIKITDPEWIKECQFILNNLGKDFVVED